MQLCFRTKVPLLLLQEQSQYEQLLAASPEKVYLIDVKIEPPITIVKQTASLKQVIELFERLHLNSLVISDINGRSCGFIDRFMLARLIHLGFHELQELLRDAAVGAEFEIDDDESEERFLHV